MKTNNVIVHKRTTFFSIYAFVAISVLTWPPFDLSIFINKLFDTFLEIIVLTVGFILLNIYWNRREENRKGAPYHEYFKSQVVFIELTSKNMSDLVHQSFPPEMHEEVNKRNELLKNEIERIEVIRNAIEKVITAGYEKLDDQTARGFAFYQTYLEPPIEKIIKHRYLEIQPNLTYLGNYFSELSRYANELTKKLQES